MTAGPISVPPPHLAQRAYIRKALGLSSLVG